VEADQTSGDTSEIVEAALFANFDCQNGPDSVELREPRIQANRAAVRGLWPVAFASEERIPGLCDCDGHGPEYHETQPGYAAATL
jgi:hypothetical protein